MMIERKKKIIDGMDRDILRFIYKNPDNSTHQISKHVNLSPSSVTLRLKNLKKSGIVKSFEFGVKREFKRNYTRDKPHHVSAIPKVLWSVDFAQEHRRGNVT